MSLFWCGVTKYTGVEWVIRSEPVWLLDTALQTYSIITVPIQQRQVGSIADYDPLNGNWGTVGSSRAAEKIGTVICVFKKCFIYSWF